MKIVIKRIESINRKGTSKSSGKPYHIDVTNIISDVPFDEQKNEVDDFAVSFGAKDLVYQVGDTPSSANYIKYGLDKLRGLLPCECDIELGQGFDSYGNPTVCVVDIKPLQKSKAAQ